MKSQDQAWVCLVGIRADTHAACLSALLLCLTRMDHASSKCTARCIKTAGYYRSACCKSALGCCLLIYRSYYLIAGNDFRKKFHWNSQLLTHLRIPCTSAHIKTMQSVSLGKILCHCTGQPVGNKAVGLKNLVDSAVYFRHVLLIPQNLRCSIGRLKGITSNFKNILAANFIIESVTNLLCPGVHPDWCICQHISILVNGYG